MDTLDDIRRAIDANLRPQAVRLARKLAATAATTEMLELASLLSEHAMHAPLADIWRRRGARDARESGPFATTLNALAMEALREGRSDEAFNLLHEALEQADLAFIRRNLASALLQKGEFESALAELDRLLSTEPDDPQSLLLLGIARYQAGDPELAIEPLSRAEGADALLWLLKAQGVSGRLIEANDTLRRLRDGHPDRAEAMLEIERNEPGSPLHLLDAAD
jgi:tetratricopeptide (TPR) repeat protein